MGGLITKGSQSFFGKTSPERQRQTNDAMKTVCLLLENDELKKRCLSLGKTQKLLEMYFE